MNNVKTVTLSPQFIEYSDTDFNSIHLHKIQKEFLNYSNFSNITIVIAPTGTGKTYSFALPIINKHRENKLSSIKESRRGIIVSPTNALIKDMAYNLKQNFKEVSIDVLNSSKLKEKGPERWKEILSILYKNELIITNPDLLNFIITGKYLYEIKGERQWTELFEHIDYFVFDEYHLYDEEQIANILSFILLKDTLFPHKEIKFIFTSATPEKALEEFLKDNKIEYMLFEEVISNREENSRAIHGKIELNFIKSEISNYILTNKKMIYDFKEENKKILIIFDKLREAHLFLERAKREFIGLRIEEETGWITKSNLKPNLADCDIIVGTNKVEVGVNYDVDACFMDQGKYFRNFLQRIGRVARGNRKGYIFIFVDKLRKIETVFNKTEYTYYDFIEKYRNIQVDKKTYSEKISKFMGCFLFVVRQGITDTTLRKMFFENVKLNGETKRYFDLMYGIDKRIKGFSDIDKNKGFFVIVKKWQDWWNIFLNTFCYFRTNNLKCKVIDKDRNDLITEYNIEWVLQNKNIIGKKDGVYVVKGMTEESKGFLYVVDSFPIGDYAFSKNECYFDVKETFIKKLKNLHDDVQYYDENIRQYSTDLIKTVGALCPVITQKRVSIKDIQVDENII
ncbi:type I-D CRISPR-associated helicase Cas3' [archaeon]|nr:type I-D CRISPR-associated helicase Cas3' [archaeon]